MIDEPTNELANSVLETLQAINRHTANCRQCRTDPRWCDTHKTYTASFQHEYAQWEEQHASAKTSRAVHA